MKSTQLALALLVALTAGCGERADTSNTKGGDEALKQVMSSGCDHVPSADEIRRFGYGACKHDNPNDKK